MSTKEDNSFIARFHQRAEVYSPFCLGVDPSDKALGGRTITDYCKAIAELIIKEQVALVKPQSAYFERFGAQGIAALEALIKTLRTAGTLVLLDVKRGDIASTNEAYAAAYFSAGAPLEVDGITLSAYLGFEDLAPFFAYKNKYAFVVAASSNEAGAKAAHQQGEALEKLIANIGSQPLAGAVIGATRSDLTAKLLAPLNDSLLLAPGLGAQGASFADLAKRFPNLNNVIPTASRSVLEAADPTIALRHHKEEAQNLRLPPAAK